MAKRMSLAAIEREKLQQQALDDDMELVQTDEFDLDGRRKEVLRPRVEKRPDLQSTAESFHFFLQNQKNDNIKGDKQTVHEPELKKPTEDLYFGSSEELREEFLSNIDGSAVFRFLNSGEDSTVSFLPTPPAGNSPSTTPRTRTKLEPLREKLEKEKTRLIIAKDVNDNNNNEHNNNIMQSFDDVNEEAEAILDDEKSGKFMTTSPRTRVQQLDSMYKYTENASSNDGLIFHHGLQHDKNVDELKVLDTDIPVPADEFLQVVAYFGDLIHDEVCRDRDLLSTSSLKLSSIARNRMAMLLSYNIKVYKGRVKHLLNKKHAHLFNLKMQYKDAKTFEVSTHIQDHNKQMQNVVQTEIENAENELLTQEPITPRTQQRRWLSQQPLEFSVRRWMEQHDILVKYTLDSSTKERYRKVFDLLDEDQGGSLDLQELDEALTSLDLKFNSDELESIARGIDHNFDGEISYDEFVNGLAARDEWDTLLTIFKDRKERGNHKEVLPFTYWVPAYHRMRVINKAKNDFLARERQTNKSENTSLDHTSSLLPSSAQRSVEDIEVEVSEEHQAYENEKKLLSDFIRKELNNIKGTDENEKAHLNQLEKERNKIAEHRKAVVEDYHIQTMLHKQGYTSSTSLWKRAQQSVTEDGEIWNLNPEGQGEEAEMWKKHKEWTKWKVQLAREEQKLRERKLVLEAKALRHSSPKEIINDDNDDNNDNNDDNNNNNNNDNNDNRSNLKLDISIIKSGKNHHWLAGQTNKVSFVRVDGLSEYLDMGYESTFKADANDITDEDLKLDYGSTAKLSKASKNRIKKHNKKEMVRKQEKGWR